jgi:hypothetical protein
VTKQDVGKLCFKLFGLYVFVNALTYGLGVATSAYSMLSMPASSYGQSRAAMQGQIAISVFNAFCLFFLSALLWFEAGFFAARVFPIKEEPDADLNLSPHILQKIAFIFAGILIFSGALHSLTSPLSRIILFSADPYTNLTQDWIGLGFVVIRIILGLWLIFGSSRIISAFKLSSEKIGNLNKKDW